jgi:hypothetical protein
MHHEQIELNFDASCQQIVGLESQYAYFSWRICFYKAASYVLFKWTRGPSALITVFQLGSKLKM